uniref:ethanolamine kinase n=1 Tax=Periophthalmus magnuspinnatus TaxID=409849 RepID=A0A3B4A587_9GOBI
SGLLEDMELRCSDIPHVDLEINEEEPEPGILELLQILRPDWCLEQVYMKSFTEGITNRLIGCFVRPDQRPDPDSDLVLVRLYGRHTDLFVDRSREVQMVRLLESRGCGPKIYCSFRNGISYEYLPGAPLSDRLLTQPHIYRLVAAEMAMLHLFPLFWFMISGLWSFLWSLVRFWSGLVPGPEVLRTEMVLLKSSLSRLRSPVVLCHNDLLTKNIIYNKEIGTVKFIDFEYCDFNYQAFDIGNHFNEFAGVSDLDYSRYPSPGLQKDWITTYLKNYSQETGSEVTEQEVTRLYVHVCKFSLASNLFWGMWAILQSKLSSIDFDFRRCSLSFTQVTQKPYVETLRFPLI